MSDTATANPSEIAAAAGGTEGVIDASAAEQARRDAFEAATEGRELTPEREPSEREVAEQEAEGQGDQDSPEKGEAPDDASNDADPPAGKAEKHGSAKPQGIVHTAKTPEERQAIVEARRAITRDLGSELAEEAMKHIPTDVLLKMGERRREHQAALDTRFRETAQARTKDTAQTTDEGAPDDTDPLDELLREIEGEREPKAQERERQQTQEPTQADETRVALFHTRLQLIQRDLADEFPGIKDEGALEKLLPVMKRLDPSEQFADDEPGLRQLVKDAAWIAFGESRAKREADKATRRTQVKKTRTELSDEPDVGGGGDVPPKPRSGEEIRREAFDKAMAATSNG